MIPWTRPRPPPSRRMRRRFVSALALLQPGETLDGSALPTGLWQDAEAMVPAKTGDLIRLVVARGGRTLFTFWEEVRFRPHPPLSESRRV